LQGRAERQARQPGSAPPSRRNRTAQPPTKKGGLLSSLSLPVLAAILGGVVLVGYLIYAVTNSGETSTPDWIEAQLDASTKLPGQYVPPQPGPDGKFGTSDDRQHISNGTVIPLCSAEVMAADQAVTDPYQERPAVANCYNSNPPTSGNHAESPMAITILQNPAPKENLVHSMEHGAVVVWYNTSDQAVIDQLKSVVQSELDRKRMVVMSQYSGMEADTIALTGWTRLDKFSTNDFDSKRVRDFIEEHQRRFNPENF
jgi:hypothetical protein